MKHPCLLISPVRLAFGLATLLLLTSWRSVPLAFFRTHCQVTLGLLVLAALDASREAGLRRRRGASWSPTALLAYVAAVSWGLGLPRIAVPTTLLIALGTAAWLTFASRTTATGALGIQRDEPVGVGLPDGRDPHGHAPRSSLPDRTHDVDRAAGAIRPIMGWGLGARGLIALLGLSVAHFGLGGVDPELVRISTRPSSC